jgi:hypothetical protein
MIIEFRNTKLGKICSSAKELQRKYGAYADRIQKGLAILRAVDSLAEVPAVPPTRCHPHINKSGHYYTIDTKHPYRILFKVGNTPVPLSDGNEVIRKAVTHIVIEDVHHDPH